MEYESENSNLMLNDPSNPYIESTTVLSDNIYRKIIAAVRLGGLAGIIEKKTNSPR